MAHNVANNLQHHKIYMKYQPVYSDLRPPFALGSNLPDKMGDQSRVVLQCIYTILRMLNYTRKLIFCQDKKIANVKERRY